MAGPEDFKRKPERVLPETPKTLDLPKTIVTSPEDKDRAEAAAKIEAGEKRGRDIANETAIQDALDKLHGPRKGPTREEAPREEPKKLTTVEVTTKGDFREWMKVLKEIFTDPTDLGSNQEFARLFFTQDKARFYFVKDGEKPIGVQMLSVNPNVPDAMYVPYGGLLADYRNLNVYPQASRIIGEQMQQFGVKYSLNDVEDPSRIRGVYPDENQEEVVARCKGRINFFKRSLGMYFVNDPEVAYCRPASDDPKEGIQAYDLLGFRPLDSNDPMWKESFNEDKTAISREAYEKFYLDIMQLEYGSPERVPSKEELRKEYPAIDQFFKELETHPEKRWISLDAGPTRQKTTPDITRPVHSGGAPEASERDRWRHTPKRGPGWEEPLRKEAA